MLNREQSIRATFDIFKPEGVIEVRAMAPYPFSGYFKDREALVKSLARNDDKTWYFVMNDIDEACYSREQSEKILQVKKGMQTTGDKEIKAIRWILVDADPVRASGVSATDDEKAKAYAIIGRIYKYLRSVGFSYPLVCDSGNGYHLLYNVRIRVEQSELVNRFLQALDMMFSDSDVKIDTAVFNPSRITKVYGTVARKGANTSERPHRASGILHIPDEILPTSVSLLEKVCTVLPEPEKPTYQNGYKDRFDIDAFISKSGLRVSKDVVSDGRRKIVLDECPFNSGHKAPDSAIFVLPSGAIAFKCFHNSCQDRTWRDLRQMFDPGCYERKQEQPRTYEPDPAFPPKNRDSSKPQKETEQHFLRLCDIKNLDRSQIVSIKTGITELDKKLIGMNKGEMSIWSGGNGSGKSTLLSQIALETIQGGFRCAMFSGELTNNRAKNWLQLQAAGRQNVRQSLDGVSYYVPKAEAQAIDDWAADKLWIYNNNYGSKINGVIADFCAHAKKHQTDVIIIDNLMSLDLTEMSGEKYDRQTSLALRLSALAKELNVHIHFVCHPRKPVGFLRKADISGTADLTNAADNVFMVHRVNSDFLKLGGDYLGKSKIEKYKDFSNVIEIMKNRDLGVLDEFVGMYFEPQSKRMLNERHENKCFEWEEDFDFGAFASRFYKGSQEELPL